MNNKKKVRRIQREESLKRPSGAANAAISAHLRCDNGPELIAWVLRDWCRLERSGTIYIEPGAPWENPFVESFNSRVRDECHNTEEFGSLIEAQAINEAWRQEYNTYRPHGSLGGLTPTEYAARCRQGGGTLRTLDPSPVLSDP